MSRHRGKSSPCVAVRRLLLRFAQLTFESPISWLLDREGFQVAKSAWRFQIKTMSDNIIIRAVVDPDAGQKPIRPVLPTLETIHDVAMGMQSYANYFEENPKEVVTTVEFAKLCRAVEMIGIHIDNREKQEKAQMEKAA